MNYIVYINQKQWGQFSSDKTKEDFREEMQEQLKHLHPLNMSEENAVEYRKRYEGAIVYVYEGGEKHKHLNRYSE